MNAGDEWRDLATAGLTLLVAALCTAAAITNAIRGNMVWVAILCVLALVASLYGVSLALRKLGERE